MSDFGMVSGLLSILLVPCLSSVTRPEVPLPYQQPERIIVAIIEVDALDDPSARTKVIRRLDEPLQNIIEVTERTTPADLARAFVALAGSYARYGPDDLRHNLVARVKPAPSSENSSNVEPSHRSESSQRMKDTMEVLRHLRGGQRLDISGYGVVNAAL